MQWRIFGWNGGAERTKFREMLFLIISAPKNFVRGLFSKEQCLSPATFVQRFHKWYGLTAPCIRVVPLCLHCCHPCISKYIFTLNFFAFSDFSTFYHPILFVHLRILQSFAEIKVVWDQYLAIGC
jgi:hypothetical protein